MRVGFVLAAAAAAAVQLVEPAAAREHMWIVAPSVSLPFTRAVAERAAKAAGAPAPVIDQAETSVGFQILCSTAKTERPDAVGTTRRMTKPEFDACLQNGVRDIVEVPVGLDLLVVAQSKEAPPLRLTVKELFRALGRQFPDEYGEMNFNPHRKWSEVGKSLPNTPIEVRVMGRFSGTHEALQELLLQKGARSISEVAKHWARAPVLPKSAWEMRQDTPVVVIHESEEAIARQLVRFPSAVGILDYPVFEAHKSKLRAVEIDGAEPTPADAYDGKYPGIRTLYLYLRKDAISTVRGVSKLAAEYVSSAALGADGYLLKLGFVPLQMEVMIKTIGLARTMPTITRDALPDF